MALRKGAVWAALSDTTGHPWSCPMGSKVRAGASHGKRPWVPARISPLGFRRFWLSQGTMDNINPAAPGPTGSRAGKSHHGVTAPPSLPSSLRSSHPSANACCERAAAPAAADERDVLAAPRASVTESPAEPQCPTRYCQDAGVRNSPT